VSEGPWQGSPWRGYNGGLGMELPAQWTKDSLINDANESPSPTNLVNTVTLSMSTTDAPKFRPVSAKHSNDLVAPVLMWSPTGFCA